MTRGLNKLQRFLLVSFYSGINNVGYAKSLPRGEQSNMHKVNIFKNLFINDKKAK
jgi:hypothetical protein